MAKVMLVEDDNNLREIYEARLAAEGYTITSAKDGEEALVVAKAEKPDLIISDVMMPKISGFEMLDILRNTEGLKDTKVIMLTALGQSDDRTRADSLGADRYLVKSQVTLEDIVKAAHELLEPEAASTPSTAAAAAEITTPAAPESPEAVPAAPAPDIPVATAPAEPDDSPVVAPSPTATAPESAAPAPTPAASAPTTSANGTSSVEPTANAEGVSATSEAQPVGGTTGSGTTSVPSLDLPLPSPTAPATDATTPVTEATPSTPGAISPTASPDSTTTPPTTASASSDATTPSVSKPADDSSTGIPGVPDLSPTPTVAGTNDAVATSAAEGASSPVTAAETPELTPAATDASPAQEPAPAIATPNVPTPNLNEQGVEASADAKVESSTTSEEQSVMEAQIEDFIKDHSSATPASTTEAESSPDAQATPPAAVDPATTQAPATPETPTQPNVVPTDAIAASNAAKDKVMNDAVNELIASAEPKLSSDITAEEVPPTAPPVVTDPATQVAANRPAPTVITPTEEQKKEQEYLGNDNVTVAHKKVIKPLGSDDTKPSLDELLAQEEAKSVMAGQASATVATAPSTPLENDNTAVATAPVLPDAASEPPIAPPQPGNTFTPGAAPTEGDGMPPAPKKNDGFDPNSISL